MDSHAQLRFEPLTFADAESRQQAIDLKRRLSTRIFDFVDVHARLTPKEIAFHEYDTGIAVTWADFRKGTVAFAAKLLSYGIVKGDVVATSLPLLKEHVFLLYGALRIGAIVAPLDLRLKSVEIIRCFDSIKPKIYFHLGETPVIDFRPIVADVIAAHSSQGAAGGTVNTFVQFQKTEEGIIDGAISVSTFARRIAVTYVLNALKECCCGAGVAAYQNDVEGDDIAFLVFTTGSTGFPKPAALTHENVICNCISVQLGFLDPVRQSPEERLIVVDCLPPSHVGGLCAMLCVAIMSGELLVIVHVYRPDLVSDAIQKYEAHILGGIPAIFSLMWNSENYDNYDHSSLRFLVYAGQGVSEAFLKQMFEMAPFGGTGLGMTETGGFATCITGRRVADLQVSLGHASPFCPITIRKPMTEDGAAGDELPQGESGEICYSGPQVFVGYYGLPEKTAATVSVDGFLYTGDIGFLDETGCVHFSGRTKFILKPKGFQVFPGEVEGFIQTAFPDQIDFIAVVGVEHRLYSQGIVAILKLKGKPTATVAETEVEGEVEAAEAAAAVGGGGMEIVPNFVDQKIKEKCREIASYKRPMHYLVLGEEEDFPLNRVRKTDYLECERMAKKAVAELQAQGGWDV